MTTTEEIVGRLRAYRPYADDYARDHRCASALCLQAADLIDRLTAQLSNLNEQCNRGVGMLLEANRNLALVQDQLAELRRGEFICRKCGIRKDSEHEKPDFFGLIP